MEDGIEYIIYTKLHAIVDFISLLHNVSVVSVLQSQASTQIIRGSLPACYYYSSRTIKQESAGLCNSTSRPTTVRKGPHPAADSTGYFSITSLPWQVPYSCLIIKNNFHLRECEGHVDCMSAWNSTRGSEGDAAMRGGIT